MSALPNTAADLAVLAYNAALAEQGEHRDDTIGKLADRLIWLDERARYNRAEMHQANADGDERTAQTAAKWLRYYVGEINRIRDCTRYGEEAEELAVQRGMGS